MIVLYFFELQKKKTVKGNKRRCGWFGNKSYKNQMVLKEQETKEKAAFALAGLSMVQTKK